VTALRRLQAHAGEGSGRPETRETRPRSASKRPRVVIPKRIYGSAPTSPGRRPCRIPRSGARCAFGSSSYKARRLGDNAREGQTPNGIWSLLSGVRSSGEADSSNRAVGEPGDLLTGQQPGQRERRGDRLPTLPSSRACSAIPKSPTTWCSTSSRSPPSMWPRCRPAPWSWEDNGSGPWVAIEKATGRWVGRIGLSESLCWPAGAEPSATCRYQKIRFCEYFATVRISTVLPFRGHRRCIPNTVMSRPVRHGHAGGRKGVTEGAATACALSWRPGHAPRRICAPHGRW
jgi:hypothetical protein